MRISTICVVLFLLALSISAQADQSFERVKFPVENAVSSSSDSVKASSAVKSVRVLLEYDQASQALELIDYTESAKHPPKHRMSSLKNADYVFQCEDASGNIIGNFPLKDPNLIHHDHVHFEEGHMKGVIEGKEINEESARFEVVIPFVEHLANIRLLKMERNNSGVPLKLNSVGLAPIAGTRAVVDKNIKKIGL